VTGIIHANGKGLKKKKRANMDAVEWATLFRKEWAGQKLGFSFILDSTPNGTSTKLIQRDSSTIKTRTAGGGYIRETVRTGYAIIFRVMFCESTRVRHTYETSWHVSNVKFVRVARNPQKFLHKTR